MNGIRIVPRDRTLNRKQWKALDGAFRRAFRQTVPVVEEMYLDAMVTGAGFAFYCVMGRGKK